VVKEHLLAPILQRVAHVSGGSAVRARRQRVGRILMFHGIDGRDYPVEVFEAQLEYLAQRFTIVPLSVLVQHVANPNGGASVSGEIAITSTMGSATTTRSPIRSCADYGCRRPSSSVLA